MTRAPGEQKQIKTCNHHHKYHHHNHHQYHHHHNAAHYCVFIIIIIITMMKMRMMISQNKLYLIIMWMGDSAVTVSQTRKTKSEFWTFSLMFRCPLTPSRIKRQLNEHITLILPKRLGEDCFPQIWISTSGRPCYHPAGALRRRLLHRVTFWLSKNIS